MYRILCSYCMRPTLIFPCPLIIYAQKRVAYSVINKGAMKALSTLPSLLTFRYDTDQYPGTSYFVPRDGLSKGLSRRRWQTQTGFSPRVQHNSNPQPQARTRTWHFALHLCRLLCPLTLSANTVLGLGRWGHSSSCRIIVETLSLIPIFLSPCPISTYPQPEAGSNNRHSFPPPTPDPRSRVLLPRTSIATKLAALLCFPSAVVAILQPELSSSNPPPYPDCFALLSPRAVSRSLRHPSTSFLSLNRCKPAVQRRTKRYRPFPFTQVAVILLQPTNCRVLASCSLLCAHG